MTIETRDVTICKMNGEETTGTLFKDGVTGDRIVFPDD